MREAPSIAVDAGELSNSTAALLTVSGGWAIALPIVSFILGVIALIADKMVKNTLGVVLPADGYDQGVRPAGQKPAGAPCVGSHHPLGAERCEAYSA